MNSPMKKYLKIVFYVCLASGLLWLAACNTKPGEADHTMRDHDAEVYYTCPMHPSVVSDKPGVCPVCNMNLVKKEREEPAGSDASHETMLHLTPEQENMANIQTDTAKIGTIAEYTTLTGTIVPDETRITTIAVRASGRIEKLYARNPGEYVEKEQPLYQLYSEQLLADEADYINAWEQLQKNASGQEMLKTLLEASRRKLLLWGLTEKQISDLEKQGERSPYITFYSNTSGYITDLMVREGQFVAEGAPLMKITDLSALWVEAQVYAGENTLRNHVAVDVSVEQFPGMILKGNVAFYNPRLEQNTKINLVRIAIDNPGNKLKPGMMAYVHLRQNEERALVIPKSAVLMEKMKTVWIWVQPGMYERRMVETGTENPYEIAITKGLAEGDVVVSSGAYLLNSEYILKSGASVKHNH